MQHRAEHREGFALQRRRGRQRTDSHTGGRERAKRELGLRRTVDLRLYRDGTVSLVAAGDVRWDASVNPAAPGDKITVVAHGTVGFRNTALTVDDGSGASLNDLTNDNPVACVSGLLGSLDQGPRVLGLRSNSVLADNHGAIQSAFEEHPSFKLDSNPVATETRIFSVEGTGVLPSEDPCE